MSETVIIKPLQAIETDRLIFMPAQPGLRNNAPGSASIESANRVAALTGLPAVIHAWGMSKDTKRIEDWTAAIESALESTRTDKVALLGYAATCGPLFELAAQNTIPISSMYMVNPIGFSKFHFDERPRTPAYFSQLQRSVLETDRSPRLLQYMRHLKAIRQNEKYWSSGQAYIAAGYVAAALSHITVDITFTPGFETKGTVLRDKISNLQLLRYAQQEGVDIAPFRFSNRQDLSRLQPETAASVAA